MAEHQTTSSTGHVPAGEHGGGFPPFAKETFASQLVWLVICFAALYLLISRIAIPRIGGIIESREKRIADDLAEAQRMKADSEAAGAAYEKSLADARNRAQSMGSEIHAKLNAEAEQNRKSLEAKLNAQLADAEKQIATTKSAAMAYVRGIAVDAAAAIVERLTGAAPAATAVAAAVDDTLKG
jgi:F-type H+-transporting ATPase subunit b